MSAKRVYTPRVTGQGMDFVGPHPHKVWCCIIGSCIRWGTTAMRKIIACGLMKSAGTVVRHGTPRQLRHALMSLRQQTMSTMIACPISKSSIPSTSQHHMWIINTYPWFPWVSGKCHVDISQSSCDFCPHEFIFVDVVLVSFPAAEVKCHGAPHLLLCCLDFGHHFRVVSV